MEERNNTWNTPYLFNAKELDEETGLYYYRARYYESRVSVWLSTDPLQEKYPNVSTYAYCLNNPVRFTDPNGNIVIPIHGTWSTYGTWKDLRGILTATKLAFNDENLAKVKFNWSGGNYASERTKAAIQPY
ncbi:MAG: RHS repeat-associated core domain-containing protein [Dysgonamonadaceae bacterium]|nr:RHS repeat-associated core domain-containing protein [Dysgonamonadaceae bacterium]